jgi:hypothetical protein
MNKDILVTEKSFDTVKFFRSEKEKIAKETEGMNFEELKAYLNKRKIKHGNKRPGSQRAV